MRCRPAGTIVSDICGQAKVGYGFVPLLGTGLSYSSGIPIIRELASYLTRCVCRALARAPEQRWEPWEVRWPSVSELESISYDRVVAEFNQRWKHVHRQLQSSRRQYDARTCLLLEAIGSLGDWRSTLRFLSRLRPPGDHLGAPDDRVIDSLFRHITEGRQPNVSHVLLAHLSRGLRVDTILTSNFDSLIEQAFSRLAMPLSTFDVHQRDGLPSADLVLAQRSIVKLNGGQYGLRADSSLDENPSDEDKNTFAEYLRGTVSSGNGGSRHLLVMGTSGQDTRTLRLIAHALHTVSGMRAYWIARSKPEASDVKRRFDEIGVPVQSLFFTACHDTGLFLLETYERLHGSLPPPGADFSAFWYVAPFPYTPPKKAAARALKRSVAGLTALIRGGAPPAPDRQSPRHLPRTVMVRGERYVTSVCAAAFQELSTDNDCIWLELDDFMNPEDLFKAMLDATVRKLGISMSAPLLAGIAPEACAHYLERSLAEFERNIVMFLDARDGPGLNAGPEGESWSKKAIDGLFRFLRAMKSRRVLIVLMVCKDRLERETADLAGLGTYGVDVSSDREFDEQAITSAVINRLYGHGQAISSTGFDIQEQRRFVYALTLFRHSRPPAVRCSWPLVKAPRPLAVGFDNDQSRFRFANQLLGFLRRFRAVRGKLGGFVWMHRDVREELRRSLETTDERLLGLRAECHQGIADWYVKLFRSSNDPLAAMESLYHRLRCIQSAKHAAPDLGGGDTQHLIETACIEALTTLHLARPSVLASGYFTTSCQFIAKLPDVADRCGLAREAGLRLRRMCYRILVDFSLEAAAFDKAEYWGVRLAKLPLGRRPVIEVDKDLGTHVARLSKQHDVLIGRRCYDRAERALVDILRKLRLKPPPIDSTADPRTRVHSARSDGREWARRRGREHGVVKHAIRALRKFLFLDVLMAQIHFLTGAEKKRRQRLIHGELIYVLGTEIMRYVDDTDFLQSENAYFRVEYGVLLSDLGRHMEAHRRLDEAAAYLAHSSRRDNPVSLAIIDLRRARLHLNQLRELLPKNREARDDAPRQVRMALALARDAQTFLERARRHLEVGQSRNVWWWTWLYECEMTVCVYLSYLAKRGLWVPPCSEHRPAASLSLCRTCDNRRCVRLLGEGAQLIRLDTLRLARLIDRFVVFYTNMGLKPGKADRSELTRALRQLVQHLQKRDTRAKSRPYPPVLRYARGVLKRGKALLRLR